MTNINMASVNMLIKKCYLLAGMVMAANMFIVNEVKASTNEEQHKDEKNENNIPSNMFNSNLNINNTLNNPPVQSGAGAQGPNPNILQYSNQSNFNNSQYVNPLFQTLSKSGNMEPAAIMGNQTCNEKTMMFIENKFKNINSNMHLLLRYNNMHFLLRYRHWINIVGGLTISAANNYFRWWDYKQGVYLQFGFLGYRFKSFAKGIFQLEINLNLCKGIFWTILAGILTRSQQPNLTTIGLMQQFISVPLTVHFAGVSISIAFDSILWMVIDIFLPNLSSTESHSKGKPYEQPLDEQPGKQQYGPQLPIKNNEKGQGENEKEKKEEGEEKKENIIQSIEKGQGKQNQNQAEQNTIPPVKS